MSCWCGSSLDSNPSSKKNRGPVHLGKLGCLLVSRDDRREFRAVSGITHNGIQAITHSEGTFSCFGFDLKTL